MAAGQRLVFAGSEEPSAFLELRSIRFPDAKRDSVCAALTDLTRLSLLELLAVRQGS
jgi:uncharacterized membrane protein YjdF